MARTTNNSSVNRLDEGGVLSVASTSSSERQASHDQQPHHHEAPRQRKLLPVPSNLDLEREHPWEEAEERGPAPPPSPTNRRGRKPASATMSRSAREAARKSNHSRIEKLRREKINDALASLRELVPNEATSVDEDEDDVMRGGQQKEFKLDILERTVVYLRKLKARVEELEGEGEGEGDERESMDVEEQDQGPEPLVKKRGRRSSKSRADLEEDAYEDENDGSAAAQHVQRAYRSSSLISRHSPSAPQAQTQTQHQHAIRLPSFASLLNQSPLLSPLPTSSAYSHHPSPIFHPPNPTLPLSPPSSGRSRPYHPSAMPNPPSLHLPSSSFHATPWTGGENSGAMDLLQCSAERSSLSPEMMTRRAAVVETDEARGSSAGVTPASMLGIDHLMRPSGSLSAAAAQVLVPDERLKWDAQEGAIRGCE